ncbi:hypothetical protein O3P69_009301 [Scylla paramamosain]|uniref:Uncharacterized protein n=1 Tax=Scylla paramamosain TaxID=85552 RepID=A0AAW0T9Z1_SCYPA
MSRACYDCPRNKTDCERPECITADGSRRMIFTVNKQLPGPAIQVCVGDKVLVDVMNNLPSSAIALHWHGVTMGATSALPDARSTPYMDGAAGVTQCPIPPGSGFRYAFFATDPGTHMWHAGLERGDGLFGALIVTQSSEDDPYVHIEEHMLVISDWYNKSSVALLADRHSAGPPPRPSALLINGRGTRVTSPAVPPPRLLIQEGTRYRLRVVSAAAALCPVTLNVEGHDLIILALDGEPVSFVNASTILLNPGERYDVMFRAEQEFSSRPNGTFWVRVVGGGACEGLYQHAALQYLPDDFANFTVNDTLPEVPPVTAPSSDEESMKYFTGSCDAPGQRCLSHLSSLSPVPSRITSARADHTLYLAFMRRYSHNQHYYSLFYYDIFSDPEGKRLRTPQINNLSFRPPPKPLLTNWKALKSENCSADTGVRVNQCVMDFCECIHVIPIKKGALVEMVMVGEGPANETAEPVHIHGYKFWVLSQVEASALPEIPPFPTPPPPANGTTPPPPPLPPFLYRDGAKKLDEQGQLVRDLNSPILKDTVSVPAGGYTIVRFIADHPGLWLLESQVSLSAASGMALVLQVGEKNDVPSRPPPDFPTC